MRLNHNQRSALYQVAVAEKRGNLITLPVKQRDALLARDLICVSEGGRAMLTDDGRKWAADYIGLDKG
jgi:hypothetical protein